MTLSITKEFRFDAAHFLPTAAVSSQEPWQPFCFRLHERYSLQTFETQMRPVSQSMSASHFVSLTVVGGGGQADSANAMAASAVMRVITK